MISKLIFLKYPKPSTLIIIQLLSDSREGSELCSARPCSPKPRACPRAGPAASTCSLSALAKFADFCQDVARFRLYRHRFLQENMRFAAFFKIYQIIKLTFLKFDKILQILRHLQFFC